MPEQQETTVQTKVHCRIITPQRVVLDTEATAVEVHGVNGVIEVLPSHEPLMVPLAIGVGTVDTTSEGSRRFALHGGFLDTDGSSITILADAAEDATEIDRDRAQEALTRAQAMLEKVSTGNADDVEIDIDRAKLAILRATMRMRAVEEPSGDE